MISDDRLRSLLASDDIPPSLSPERVRAQARRLQRTHRIVAVAAVVVLVPTVVLAAGRVAGWSPGGLVTAGGGGHLPPAFDGYGNPLQQQPDGKVALEVPHQYAYLVDDSLCWGSASETGNGGECLVAHENDLGGSGLSVGDGVIGSISQVPVARADFILGTHVVHAQVVGFAKYPRWRTLTAAWNGPEAGVLVRGWDASGKLILSEGCLGGCAIPAEPSQPPVTGDPAPAASSAPPTPVPTAVPDTTVSVIDGVEAYSTAHGVCVADQAGSQCVTDGDTAIDNGFALGKDIAVTIVGEPLARAEFEVGTTEVPATVLGFASHPQWRVVAANLKIPGAAGKPVVLKGWDAAGTLVVDSDPR